MYEFFPVSNKCSFLGLCTSGSQFGGISLAPLSQVLFDRLGYANTFRTFAGLLLVVAISSLVYRSELSGNTSRSSSTKKSPKEMLSVWKSKPYIVWALGTTLVTLGYNIPRYTLVSCIIGNERSGLETQAEALIIPDIVIRIPDTMIRPDRLYFGALYFTF